MSSKSLLDHDLVNFYFPREMLGLAGSPGRAMSTRGQREAARSQAHVLTGRVRRWEKKCVANPRARATRTRDSTARTPPTDRSSQTDRSRPARPPRTSPALRWVPGAEKSKCEVLRWVPMAENGADVESSPNERRALYEPVPLAEVVHLPSAAPGSTPALIPAATATTATATAAAPPPEKRPRR